MKNQNEILAVCKKVSNLQHRIAVLSQEFDEINNFVGFNSASGQWITNPFLSECGRFDVDPIEHYGEDNIMDYYNQIIGSIISLPKNENFNTSFNANDYNDESQMEKDYKANLAAGMSEDDAYTEAYSIDCNKDHDETPEGITIRVKELVSVDYVSEDDTDDEKEKLSIRVVTYQSSKQTLQEAFDEYMNINNEFDINNVIDCDDDFLGGVNDTISILSVEDIKIPHNLVLLSVKSAETEEYLSYKNIVLNNLGLDSIIGIVDYVNQLRNFINEDNEVLDEIDDKLSSFNNVISLCQTKEECPKCSETLYLSDLPQYNHYCFECDENF